MCEEQYNTCQECPYFKDVLAKALEQYNDMGTVVSNMWEFADNCNKNGCKTAEEK